MEEEGLLPNVQKEEMEQGETGIKPTGMDIRSEEELGAAGEGFGHKGMTHNEKLSDWDPVDRIRMEEEFQTPPRKGDQRKWTGFRRMDLGIRYLIWVWCQIMWRHKV